MNSKTPRRVNRSAFTILELLIVLVILVGILAIVGPRLLGSQDKADRKMTKAQIKTIERALKEYKFEMKSYPKTEDGLQALITKPSDEKQAKKWDGPYLDESSVPVDAWDNEFIYKYEPSSEGLDKPLIISKGPDGEENTDDDIANYEPSENGGSGSNENESSKNSGGDDFNGDFE